MEQFNSRILVIDDDETVRNSFRQILEPQARWEKTDNLTKAGAILFGGGKAAEKHYKRSSAVFNFEYDEAQNGKRGYEKVKKAVEAGKPYAVVFVDMRMPGWDGLETVSHLREVDTRCEVIFVTAYTDYSIDEIVTSVGTNVSYHCKPFSVEEIEQIATKAVYEWNKTKSLEDLIRTISELRGQKWQMEPLLENILQQVAYLMGTHSAMIAMKKNTKYEKLLAIGNLCDDDTSSFYLESIPDSDETEVFQNDDLAYFRLEEYGILAIFEKGGKPLNKERTYLVRLFLEQAVQAIENVGLQEELLKKEKLSIVGQASGMIVHDLKNSIGIIKPAIEMIRQNPDDKKFAEDMFEMITVAVDEGMGYLEDILDFTSNKKIHKEKTSVPDLIDEIKSRTMLLLRDSKVDFSVDCPHGGIIVVDHGKIYRVISNLIKNALESFEGHDVATPQINLSFKCDGDNLKIDVSDNGPGIPEDIIDRLFVPFVTKGKISGSGLGLAIVKQIVEAHHGKITTATSPDGTTFHITIPQK